jgi:hypothetical protein
MVPVACARSRLAGRLRDPGLVLPGARDPALVAAVRGVAGQGVRERHPQAQRGAGSPACNPQRQPAQPQQRSIPPGRAGPA